MTVHQLDRLQFERHGSKNEENRKSLRAVYV